MMNTKFSIRHSRPADLDAVMAIFEYAKKRMRLGGNMTQWVGGYPSRQVVVEDMESGCGYVIESEGRIVGVFSYIKGEDPCYATIEGAWPDSEPYGTIHRLAAARGASGIADAALNFCKRAGVNIRIDTHADNVPMLGWVAKRGFRYCGIVKVADGSPRKAFQLNVP